MSLFIMCGRGIEAMLLAELTELGLSNITTGYCGVYVADSRIETIYTINYRSRLASRVLWPLQKFDCDSQDDLYRHACKMDWSLYIKQGQTIAIDANVQHPHLRHSLFAAQLVKDAICDSLREKYGFRPSVNVKNPDVQLNLFIDEDQATISLDTSGRPLYKRGYRLDAGDAPLQETLAALLLRVATYDPHNVVIDPCCGSGTLLIEAAMIASKTAPGYLRQQWGFFAHPKFNEQKWLAYKNSVDMHRVVLPAGMLWGCERDREIARIARENIAEAGFSDAIKIEVTDFERHVPHAEYQFLITNPPHGKRIGHDEDLKPLYRSIGDFMKQKMKKPARGFVYTSNKNLGKEVGLAAKRRHIISSGGLEGRLLEFDVY